MGEVQLGIFQIAIFRLQVDSLRCTKAVDLLEGTCYPAFERYDIVVAGVSHRSVTFAVERPEHELCLLVDHLLPFPRAPIDRPVGLTHAGGLGLKHFLLLFPY